MSHWWHLSNNIADKQLNRSIPGNGCWKLPEPLTCQLFDHCGIAIEMAVQRHESLTVDVLELRLPCGPLSISTARRYRTNSTHNFSSRILRNIDTLTNFW
ncbi:hypothetical protein TNCT_397501 [Trichonephila clavata]|uniref:Uncharacterized protein n=1 Tax=Trichonephila clavata TaxID=2740835 RepID=A0A8X6K995_TRICU|nr:hypothetical protein TNCT_397501 [Trichonephila clavata]